MFVKITKTRSNTGKKHPNAPLPGSFNLLTLSQTSLATNFYGVTWCAIPGIKSKSFFSNLKFWKFSDFENFEIPKNFEEKNHHRKIWKFRDFFWPKYFQKYFAGGGLVFSDFGLGQRPLRIELLISGNFGCFVSTFQACSETRPRLALPRGLI